MLIPKQKKVKCAKYKYWLAENGQCVCLLVGREKEMECKEVSGPPHHLPIEGGGIRRSRDDQQIPICQRLHRFYHDNPDEERKDLPLLYEVAARYWDWFQQQKRRGK